MAWVASSRGLVKFSKIGKAQGRTFRRIGPTLPSVLTRILLQVRVCIAMFTLRAIRPIAVYGHESGKE